MSVLSLKKVGIVLTSTVFGTRSIKNWALDGEAINYGWMEEELYNVLQGMKDSLAVENPSSVYTVTFAVVPLSYDDRFLTSWINNIKTLGTQDLSATFYNDSDKSAVVSDECYIITAPRTVISKTPSAKVYTLLMVNAVTKNPGEIGE